MNTKNITQEEFVNGARDAVLAALDAYMRDLTGTEAARGATDADLPRLFSAIDEHMGRVAARINDPESQEVGSGCLAIVA